jgi:2-dehydro-3-deoxyphosphogalactonate aldolase
MVCLPGVLTPTEAFAALRAGATALKLFPAELIGPEGVKALRAVLPSEARLFPVGGVTPENLAAYCRAGAAGFGIGSALYRPGLTDAEIAPRALAFASSLRACATGK